MNSLSAQAAFSKSREGDGDRTGNFGCDSIRHYFVLGNLRDARRKINGVLGLAFVLRAHCKTPRTGERRLRHWARKIIEDEQ